MKIRIIPSTEFAEKGVQELRDEIDDLPTTVTAAQDLEKGSKVRVMAHLPHVQRWGHQPTHEMTYGWPGGPLAIGDLVACPPTPLGNGRCFVGVVTAFGDGGYKGPVKMLLGRADEVEMDQN